MLLNVYSVHQTENVKVGKVCSFHRSTSAGIFDLTFTITFVLELLTTGKTVVNFVNTFHRSILQ